MERHSKHEDKYEARIPKSHRAPEGVFNILSIRTTTALRSRELATGLADKDVHLNIDEKAIAIILATIGDSPLVLFRLVRIVKHHRASCSPGTLVKRL